MQDLKYLFGWALFSFAALALSLIFVGGQVRDKVIRDRVLFFAAVLIYLLVWPLALLAAAYTGARRWFMLRWMAQRFQTCSRMDWAGCWHAAVTGMNQQQEWGDLTLWPTPEWDRDGARSLADAEMESWDGD